MSTPNNLPAGNDQPLMQCATLYLYSIHSFYRERLAEAENRDEDMRIIAGAYRSRPLKSLPGFDLRPTSDRLRETLFNVLTSATTLEGSVWLDLFAGTGAVGIEALSRGARQVYFVESERKHARLRREKLRLL